MNLKIKLCKINKYTINSNNIRVIHYLKKSTKVTLYSHKELTDFDLKILQHCKFLTYTT